MKKEEVYCDLKELTGFQVSELFYLIPDLEKGNLEIISKFPYLVYYIHKEHWGLGDDSFLKRSMYPRVKVSFDDMKKVLIDEYKKDSCPTIEILRETFKGFGKAYDNE